MKQFTPITILALAALVVAGCRSSSYRLSVGPMHPDEPTWISRGAGKFRTEEGHKLVAVGRAWEEPEFDIRRRAALENARGELREQLDAYVDGLVDGLAVRSRQQFGSNPTQARVFFGKIGREVVEARTRGLEPTREWESVIRHEVYIQVELPTAAVVEDFRKAILAGIAAGEGRIFPEGSENALEKLDRELEKAVARSPLGDLSA